MKHLLVLLLLPILYGCGSNTETSPPPATIHGFSDAEKQFLNTLFHTEYLWYDQVPAGVDTSRFSKPNQMIDALRVNPPDKWSVALSTSQFENFGRQKSYGYGFYHTRNFTIIDTFIGSPAWQKLRRGDKIVAINDDPDVTNAIQVAASKRGTPTKFTVLRHGSQTDLYVAPDYYDYKVTLGKTFIHNGKRIAYLRYDQFSGNSLQEFEKAFTQFKAYHPNELIIDLRYNGGGSVDIASALLDNITNAFPGQRQFYLDWNARNKEKNYTFRFETVDLQDGNELTMQRVFFLVTKASASASELIINALKPYLGENDVITIGTHTDGKPVGMQGRVYIDSQGKRGNYIYFLINFFIRNNVGQTTPFEGIAPTCSAADDITHLRGDPNETMLATAIYYIDNNSCPPSSLQRKLGKDLSHTITSYTLFDQGDKR